MRRAITAGCDGKTTLALAPSQRHGVAVRSSQALQPSLISDAARKSRTIERKLKGVQLLPSAGAETLLAEAVEADDGVDIRPPV